MVMGRIEYRCWSEDKVRRVFTVESEEKPDDKLFMYLHQPMSFILSHEKTKLPEPKEMSEGDLLEFLISGDASLRKNERLIAITGPPGTGKSQICRWLKIKLTKDSTSSVHSPDYIFYFTRDKMSPRIFKKDLIDFLRDKGVELEDISKEIKTLLEPDKILAYKIISNTFYNLREKLDKAINAGFIKFLNQNLNMLSKEFTSSILPVLKAYVNFYNEGKTIITEDEYADDTSITHLVHEDRFLSMFQKFGKISELKNIYPIFINVLRKEFYDLYDVETDTISNLLTQIEKGCPSNIRPLIIFEDMTTIGIDVKEIFDFFTNKARPWDVVFSYTFELEDNIIKSREHYYDRLDLRLVTASQSHEAPKFLDTELGRYEFISKYMKYIQECKTCMSLVCEMVHSGDRAIYPFNNVFIENIFRCLETKTPREFLLTIHQILIKSGIPPKHAESRLSSEILNVDAYDATLRQQLNQSANSNLKFLMKWYGKRKDGYVSLDKTWAEIFNIKFLPVLAQGGDQLLSFQTTDSLLSEMISTVITGSSLKEKVEEIASPPPDIPEEVLSFQDNISKYRRNLELLKTDSKNKLISSILLFSDFFSLNLSILLQNANNSNSATLYFEDFHENFSPRIFIDQSTIRNVSYPHFAFNRNEMITANTLELLALISIQEKTNVNQFLNRKIVEDGNTVAYLKALLKSYQEEYSYAGLRILKQKYGVELEEIVLTVKFLLSMYAYDDSSMIVKTLRNPLSESIENLSEIEIQLTSLSNFQEIANNLIQLFQESHYWEGLFYAIFSVSNNLVSNKLLKFENKSEIFQAIDRTLSKLATVDTTKDIKKMSKYHVYANPTIPKTITKSKDILFKDLIQPLISLAIQLKKLNEQRLKNKGTYVSIRGVLDSLERFVNKNSNIKQIAESLQTLEQKTNDMPSIIKYKSQIKQILEDINLYEPNELLEEIVAIKDNIEKESHNCVREYLLLVLVSKMISTPKFKFLKSLYKMTIDLQEDMSISDLATVDTISANELDYVEQELHKLQNTIKKIEGFYDA